MPPMSNPPAALPVAFLEGIGDPSPDWCRMNLLACVVLDGTARTGNPLPMAHILLESLERCRAHGLPTNDEHLLELTDRLVHAGVLRAINGGYVCTLPRPVAAIKVDAIRLILEELTALLAKAAASGSAEAAGALAQWLTAMAEATDRWPAAPIESRWPVLKAVALLEPAAQQQLAQAIAANASLRLHPLLDAILLMAQGEPPADWLARCAPILQGRSVYTIAAEGWYAAGGLGRVQQYHAHAMKRLVNGHAVIATIEPYYPYRLNVDGDMEPVAYDQLPVPVVDLQRILEFDVPVKSKPVRAHVFQGTNEHGIRIILIKDEGDYYTKLIYRYGREYGAASWDEFTEFFSRVALEVVRRMESQQREAKAADWRPPVIVANDGQLGLLPVFRRIMDAHDGLLQDAAVWYVTHTYRNRGIFGGGNGQAIVEGMGVEQYWPAFHRHDLWDFTSAGVRTADAASAVSAVHLAECGPFDPAVPMVAVTNGDARARSASWFRTLLQQAGGATVDIERPSAEHVRQAKRLAKQHLGLNPDQLVISYSGRLVSEKAGRERAFTDANIERLVQAGAQVVLYGNVQGSQESRDLFHGLEALELALEGRKYPGALILRTGWGVYEQIQLLAATDVQVQDSDRGTGAAEYTESDISANGGLQMGPPWLEGIIQRQGVIIDRRRPGWGNTLIPESEEPSAYIETMLWAVRLFQQQPEVLAAYQATSVQLSRVLEALLPGAEYLRQFSRVLRWKDRPLDMLAEMLRQHPPRLEVLHNRWLRLDLARALDQSAQARALVSSEPRIKAYAVAIDGERLLLAMQVGDGPGERPTGKAWTTVRTIESFEALLGAGALADPEACYAVQDALTGEDYGRYTAGQLREGGLSVGVPKPYLQLLRMRRAEPAPAGSAQAAVLQSPASSTHAAK